MEIIDKVSEKKPIAIFGAGGQGREVLQLIKHINAAQTTQWECIGWFDDGLEKGSLVAGLEVLGGVKELNDWNTPLAIAMAVAWPSTKAKIVSLIKNEHIYFPVLIHPSVAIDEEEISIGQGTMITQGCRFTVNIKIGKFVLLNLASVFTHDVIIDDYCSIMPSVNVSGAVHIQQQTYVGTGSQIIQLLTIGENTIIGAGSVVTKDIPANCTAVGIPARVIKFHG